MKQRYLLLFVLMLLIIFSFSFFIFHASKKIRQPAHTTKQLAPLPKEVTITLNKDGFSPKEVTIKVGSAVRWKNSSGDKQTVNSDNYPSNQLHRELNFGEFNTGSSVVYIFKNVGTYGYHNQFHHGQQGT